MIGAAPTQGAGAWRTRAAAGLIDIVTTVDTFRTPLPHTARAETRSLRRNSVFFARTSAASTRAFCNASNCAGVRSFLLVGRSDRWVSCEEGWSLSAIGGL